MIDADIERFTRLAGDAERDQAMAIARDLDGIGMERDKAWRIAMLAARHSCHGTGTQPLTFDEFLD